MEEFPDELLEEIFTYCSFQDLIWNIPNVNTRWRMVSTRSKIWKNRTFCPKKEDDDSIIIEVLQRCPRLEALDFGERVVSAKVLSLLVENCTDLVKIRFDSFQEISCKFLNELQSNCQKIEEFDVNYKTLSCPEKLEIIGKFLNLRTIHSKWSMCNIKLKPLADGCPRLECLETGEVRVEMDDLTYFLSKKKDTLRTLVFPCSMTRDSNKCTIPCLSVCSSLQSLCIHWHCNNEPLLLAQTLGNMKTLKSLTWQDFCISSMDDIVRLFANRNLAHLVRLEFCSFFSYNDAVTKIIVENCPNLQGLHLGVCEEFTDKTLEMLVQLKNLKEIGIYGNRYVTDDGMRSLLHIGCLEYLLLGGCDRLTLTTLDLITYFKHLKVLKFHCQSLKDLPWHIFPQRLQYLKHVEIFRCKDLNVVALKALKKVIHQMMLSVDETSQEWAGYSTNQFP